MSTPFQLPADLFLLKHPFYQAWVDGALSRATLQDYSRQYFHHVGAFPTYLKNAIDLCEDSEAKEILKENLAEEDGTAYGTSHPELWLRFAEGTGTTREAVQSATLRDGIRNVVNTFSQASKSSYAEALGSLYAYESQVPEIAQSKIDGLCEHYGINDERSLSFFEVHKKADVAHRESILKIIEALPADQKAEAQKAANESCQALWNFLTDVQGESDCFAHGA